MDQDDVLMEYGLSDDEPSDSDPDPNPPPISQVEPTPDTFEGESSLASNLQLLEDGSAMLYPFVINLFYHSLGADFE